MPAPPDIADRWVVQVFSARAAAEGGVVRRKARDVERVVGRDRFEAEIARRGYRAVENAGQYVIFCNRDPIRVVGRAANPSGGIRKIVRTILRRVASRGGGP